MATNFTKNKNILDVSPELLYWVAVCFLENNPILLQHGLKSHFTERCQICVASPSCLTALWENVMKFWSMVNLKKSVVLFWMNNMVQYVCLLNREREQTDIPMDKKVCLASKLCYLALAKIPFSLNNVRGKCEKDAWFRDEHSCNKTVNLSTVLWEKQCCADRGMCWTLSTDVTSEIFFARNDHLYHIV